MPASLLILAFGIQTLSVMVMFMYICICIAQ